MRMSDKEYTDMMLNSCKKAHEHKDKIMEMMIAHEMNGIEIPMEMKLDLLVNDVICRANMNEITRKHVWDPANAKMREADGIHTVYVDNKSHFVHDINGYDINKAFSHLLKHMDIMKEIDPVKYNSLISEIKS